jgi:hypothetical protein
MVMNGTSLYITGELLGHRTTQMTKQYSHLVPETLKKAVDDVWGEERIYLNKFRFLIGNLDKTIQRYRVCVIFKISHCER